jgi:E3 ubiquitin-protein ligase BIG BROTHER-like protein
MTTSMDMRLAEASPEDEKNSLALAMRLQAEEEEGYAFEENDDDESAEPNDPELEASLALAMQLQQQDDAAQLAAALAGAGVVVDGGMRALSPSQLDYEQLIRLQENVGHVSRGASQDAVDELPVRTHAECCKPHSGVILGDECAICRMPFEAEEELRVLHCRHAEHKACLDQWLQVSKQCPLCQAEVLQPAAEVRA